MFVNKIWCNSGKCFYISCKRTNHIALVRCSLSRQKYKSSLLFDLNSVDFYKGIPRIPFLSTRPTLHRSGRACRSNKRCFWKEIMWNQAGYLVPQQGNEHSDTARSRPATTCFHSSSRIPILLFCVSYLTVI